MGDAAPPGPTRALATSALLAGASPVACGQCELQGVGRQVWLCLKGVGSRRNLAQRGPGWLGVRDLCACRSPRPLQATRVGRRKTAGPRPRLSPRRYVSPASQAPSFCHGPGWLARHGREKRVGGSAAGLWVLPRNAHRGVGRATAARRQMRVRPRADASTQQRRAHPQTVSSRGGPAELTVTGWCLLRSAGASRSSPRSGVSLCGCRWV